MYYSARPASLLLQSNAGTLKAAGQDINKLTRGRDIDGEGGRRQDQGQAGERADRPIELGKNTSSKRKWHRWLGQKSRFPERFFNAATMFMALTPALETLRGLFCPP
jgi:hypothetical protein